MKNKGLRTKNLINETTMVVLAWILLTTTVVSVLSLDLQPCESDFGISVPYSSTQEVIFKLGSHFLGVQANVVLTDNIEYRLIIENSSGFSIGNIFVRLTELSGSESLADFTSEMDEQNQCRALGGTRIFGTNGGVDFQPGKAAAALGSLSFRDHDSSFVLDVAAIVRGHDESQHEIVLHSTRIVTRIHNTLKNTATTRRTLQDVDKFPTRAPAPTRSSTLSPALLQLETQELGITTPTRAPPLMAGNLAVESQEGTLLLSPTRAPSFNTGTYLAQEAREAVLLYPTRAPSFNIAADLPLTASREELIVPTRAPSFASQVYEERTFPTRAPFWFGLERDKFVTVAPTAPTPTSAPTIRIPTFVPCHICGSTNMIGTKPQEIVASENTLFGTCFEVDLAGRSRGLENCEEVQALATRVCGCEILTISPIDSTRDIHGNLPSDFPSDMPSGSPYTNHDGDNSIASVISTSCKQEAHFVLLLGSCMLWLVLLS